MSSYTDVQPANCKIDVNPFLHGIARLFDFVQLLDLAGKKTITEVDTESFCKDWEVLGKDMMIALEMPHTFTADFIRLEDPELPEDQETKLVINGDFKQVADGKWWIRKVEGWVLKNPYSPNDGIKEKVLIVWRNLTGNLEEDNLILDSWFQKNRISTLDWEFDTIYVNGSNNLQNLKREGDTWKVRLIEEEFMKRMWDNQGV